jgi:hypothetical protein
MVTLLQHSDLHGTHESSLLGDALGMKPAFLFEQIPARQFCRSLTGIPGQNANFLGNPVYTVSTDIDVTLLIYQA